MMAWARRRFAVLGLLIAGKREALGWYGDCVALAAIPHNRGSVAHADEPGSSVPVHDGLVRLQDEGRAEPHLQELRTGDRVHRCRSVHARTFGGRLPHPSLRQAAIVAIAPLRRSTPGSWRADLRATSRTHRRLAAVEADSRSGSADCRRHPSPGTRPAWRLLQQRSAEPPAYLFHGHSRATPPIFESGSPQCVSRLEPRASSRA
jgi:hypothetical protein